MVERILDETQASAFNCYLTGSGNFRFDIYPEYKANRKDMVKPRWYATIREYLCDKWNATVSDGCEADDSMGMTQCSQPDTIICSIDKDMLMIPGNHYNFVKKEFSHVDDLAGLRHFYYQAIMGDKVDNIPGFDGLMRNKVPKKMQWMIDYLSVETNETMMYEFVQSEHHNPEMMDIYMKCLWIWRKDGDIWVPPHERAVV